MLQYLLNFTNPNQTPPKLTSMMFFSKICYGRANEGSNASTTRRRRLVEVSHHEDVTSNVRIVIIK
jgi:hypothetical protein